MLVLTPGAVPHLASRVCFVAVRPSVGVPPGAFRVPASRCSNPLKRGLMTHKHINAPHTHTQCLSKPVCAPRGKKWRNARSMTYDVGRRARESASRRARGNGERKRARYFYPSFHRLDMFHHAPTGAFGRATPRRATLAGASAGLARGGGGAGRARGAEETGTGGGGREIEGAIAGDGRVRRPTPVYGGGGACVRALTRTEGSRDGWGRR